jgi:site-specific DNA recombinase
MPKMIDVESKITELCARIIPDLDNCTNQDKRYACTYLDLEIKATFEGVDGKGYIQLKLLTIERTSALPREYNYRFLPA